MNNFEPSIYLRQDGLHGLENHRPKETRRRTDLPETEQSSDNNNSLSSEQWLNGKRKLLDEKQNDRIEVEKRLVSVKKSLELLEQHKEKHALLQEQVALARTDLEDKQIKRNKLKTRLDDLSANQKEKREQLAQIQKDIQDSENKLKDLESEKESLATELKNINEKINSIPSLSNGASKVKDLISILEHNGALTKEARDELIDISRRKEDFQLLDYQHNEKVVVPRFINAIKQIELNIDITNKIRKIYELFVDKLPEVTSLDTKLPSGDALKSIILQPEVVKGNTSRYISNRIEDFERKATECSSIEENQVKRLESNIPNLWLYDKKYHERQKQVLEDSIKTVEEIVNKNLSSEQEKSQIQQAYLEFLVSTQKYPWTAKEDLTAKATPPRSHSDQALDSTISQDHPPYQTQVVSRSSCDGESQHSLEASSSSDTLNPSALSEKATQTDYLNILAPTDLQKDSNNYFKEDKALGFATAEKLYTKCLSTDISDFNTFLDDAKSTLTEIEEKLKTLPNDPKTSKVIDEKLQESIKSDFKEILESNKEMYKLTNLILHEMTILYQLRKDIEKKDNVIIKKHKLQLISIPLKEREKSEEKINNLQSQIGEIRKKLDPLRSKDKSLRQKTEKRGNQPSKTKKAYESADRDVEHAQEALNKAEQAAEASSSPNLKDQIDQARSECDNLQKQLEQIKTQQSSLEDLIKAASSNLYLQGFFPILEQRLQYTSEDSNSQLLNNVSFFKHTN
jgi:chromosome segregation ATPase